MQVPSTGAFNALRAKKRAFSQSLPLPMVADTRTGDVELEEDFSILPPTQLEQRLSSPCRFTWRLGVKRGFFLALLVLVGALRDFTLAWVILSFT